MSDVALPPKIFHRSVLEVTYFISKWNNRTPVGLSVRHYHGIRGLRHDKHDFEDIRMQRQRTMDSKLGVLRL